MNYCTSLNCSVDIRGASGEPPYQLNQIVQWISGELCNVNHRYCEILKTRDIYFAISKMNYCTSLNCSVDIIGARRLNHRYFAMWTTDTKNTRYILCNLKNELLYVIKCLVDIRGAGRLNHRYFAMWTTDTKNTRYILCNLKNELLYVIKLFSGYQGSEAIEPSILCNVNHRY